MGSRTEGPRPRSRPAARRVAHPGTTVHRLWTTRRGPDGPDRGGCGHGRGGQALQSQANTAAHVPMVTRMAINRIVNSGASMARCTVRHNPLVITAHLPLRQVSSALFRQVTRPMPTVCPRRPVLVLHSPRFTPMAGRVQPFGGTTGAAPAYCGTPPAAVSTRAGATWAGGRKRSGSGAWFRRPRTRAKHTIAFPYAGRTPRLLRVSRGRIRSESGRRSGAFRCHSKVPGE